MSGDIAVQEILGPMPDRASLVGKAGEAGTNHATMKLIRDSYQVVTGRVNQTDSDFLANMGTSIRNLLSAAQLGAAFISSFGDVWTQRMTRTFNGLPSVGMIKDIFSQVRPGKRPGPRVCREVGFRRRGMGPSHGGATLPGDHRARHDGEN